MIDEVDDVAADRGLGRAGDPDRLVQRDVDVAARLARGAAREQRLAVDADLVALLDLRADAGSAFVDGDAFFGDQPVRFAA